jgi:hypothetical protein
MTKVVIIIQGGIIQAIHSNKNLQYIIVDEDLNEEDRISDVYEQDSLFPEYFDILDSEDNKVIMGKFLDSVQQEKTHNVQPEITLEQAIQTMIKHGYIRHFWHEDDIILKAENMDIELTDDQINDVITKLEDTDANLGVNWDSIEIAINDVCGVYDNENDIIGI